MNHILHAEDDENDVMMMQRAFRRAAIESTYSTVRDGDEAMAYLVGMGKYENRRAYPEPTLVLLDLNLPKVSGFEILKRIRTNPSLARTPVVILSSSVLDDDVQRASLLGANGYLAKTGNPNRLVEMVKAMHNYWLTFDQFSRVSEFRKLAASDIPLKVMI